VSRRHQGALGVRAGTPAAEGGTRPRSLRRPLLDRAAPACAADDDRVRLPAASPARAEPHAGEKPRPVHHRSRRSSPSDARSSSTLLAACGADAPTATPSSTCVNRSETAKVVLDSTKAPATPPILATPKSIQLLLNVELRTKLMIKATIVSDSPAQVVLSYEIFLVFSRRALGRMAAPSPLPMPPDFTFPHRTNPGDGADPQCGRLGTGTAGIAAPDMEANICVILLIYR
jgi:hypothetical protein